MNEMKKGKQILSRFVLIILIVGISFQSIYTSVKFSGYNSETEFNQLKYLYYSIINNFLFTQMHLKFSRTDDFNYSNFENVKPTNIFIYKNRILDYIHADMQYYIYFKKENIIFPNDKYQIYSFTISESQNEYEYLERGSELFELFSKGKWRFKLKSWDSTTNTYLSRTQRDNITYYNKLTHGHGFYVVPSLTNGIVAIDTSNMYNIIFIDGPFIKDEIASFYFSNGIDNQKIIDYINLRYYTFYPKNININKINNFEYDATFQCRFYPLDTTNTLVNIKYYEDEQKYKDTLIILGRKSRE